MPLTSVKTKLWRAEEDLQAFPQLLRHNVLVTGHPHNCRTPPLNLNTAFCPTIKGAAVRLLPIAALTLLFWNSERRTNWSLSHLMIKVNISLKMGLK